MKSKKTKKKLSAIIVDMADSILTRPVDQISDEASAAALILAAEAWNQEIDPSEDNANAYMASLQQLKKRDKHFNTYLKSTDYNSLILELREYKRQHYTDDARKIRQFAITEKGNVRVVWEEQ